MDDWREVVTEINSEKLMDDPYVYAHYELMALVAEEASQMRIPDVVAYTYDEHSKGHLLQQGWSDFKKRNPIYAEYMGSLGPLDDKRFPCIQIADLMAHTTTSAFVAHRTDPEKGKTILKAWLKELRIVAVMNKDYLRKLFAHNANLL